MKNIIVYGFILMVFSCTHLKDECKELGTRFYEFSPNALWSNTLSNINCLEGKKRLNVKIEHECLDLSTYKIAISLGNQYLYYGEYQENLLLKSCTENLSSLETIVVRIIDTETNRVFQWSKKESYKVEDVDEILIRLPHGNKNEDFAIRLN